MDGAPLEFPDDDTGDALRRLRRNGDDLTEPRDVDFTVVFATEVAASEFAEHFKKLGYKVSIKESNCVPDLPWDVLVVRHMVPSHVEISEVENELQVIADGLGGRNDGWGCFSQKDHPRTNWTALTRPPADSSSGYLHPLRSGKQDRWPLRSRR